MNFKLFSILIIVLLSFCLSNCSESSKINIFFSFAENGPKKICIQPLGQVDTSITNECKRAIERYYEFEVDVLPFRKVPKNIHSDQIIALKAYYTQPNTYRADSLLRFLLRIKPDEYNHIIGITNQDIYTTKKLNGKVKEPAWKYTHWGIFGLGLRPGESSVVSTFRLYRYTDEAGMKKRLRKVVMHELGHNLGLPHCPNPECFMRDAKEAMWTVDEATEYLCEKCKRKIN